MNNASQSFQFTTWVCCPIIAPFSGLLVLHFSALIYAAENATSFHPWLQADAYMSQVFSRCPLGSHIGTEVCFGSKCELGNLLVRYYGGSQMVVILVGPHKAPHSVTMRYPSNSLEIGVGRFGVVLLCIYLLIYLFVKLIFHSHDLNYNFFLIKSLGKQGNEKILTCCPICGFHWRGFSY